MSRHPARPPALALLLAAALLAATGCTLPEPAPPGGGGAASSAAGGAHLALGNPSGAAADPAQPDNYLIARDQYALSYSRDRGIPNWVAWHLQASDLGDTPRYEGPFIPDTSLPPGWRQTTHGDYSNGGYDRGHLTPSADRTATASDNEATFILSNVLPQAPENNRGPWAQLEDEARDLVRKDGDEAYIVAGGWGSAGTLAGGAVTVPEAVWKVLVFLPAAEGDDLARIGPDTFTIAVWMPNDNSVAGRPWDEYQTSVACVEERTGLDLLSALADDVEAALAGGACAPAVAAAAPTAPAAQPSFAIAITEVAANPPGDDAAGEYVALENTGGSPLELTGWTLSDVAGATYTFPSFTLAPGRRVRAWVASGADDAENLYWGANQAVWNNAGDTATLRDAGGYEWARISYP